ncbi:hypothetical protein NX059_009185 [Plenodomus lindquistii]|nr:hypothetical protein NX059_009185 [Plenodomus lindquistii]
MSAQDPFHGKLPGYPRLAAKIGLQPESAICRRFGALNAQNLLYYQAELSDLERRLEEQPLSDHHEQIGNKSKYARNWYCLQESEADGDTEQLELVLRIRMLLKEYNYAIIQHTVILGYPQPGKWDLHHLQDYLQTPEMGPLPFTGDDAKIWGTVRDRKSHARDLITLRPRAKKDAFSTWAAENALATLLKCGAKRFMRPSPIHGVVGYEDDTVYRITYWITSILASLIPLASIAILHRVQSMTARLAIIGTFNVLVSLCLMGLANAKRAEVFAVTAAFAAVQVVFVGQDKCT